MLVFLRLLVQLEKFQQYCIWCFHVSCTNVCGATLPVAPLLLVQTYGEKMTKVVVLWIEWCSSIGSTSNNQYRCAYQVWSEQFWHIFTWLLVLQTGKNKQEKSGEQLAAPRLFGLTPPIHSAGESRNWNIFFQFSLITKTGLYLPHKEKKD